MLEHGPILDAGAALVLGGFIGCALLAAATSLALKKFARLSSSLLGLMFFLFVSMIYLPSALRHSGNRLAWIFFLRDLSFCADAWALAGLYSRAQSPQQSKWMIFFARIVLAVAAIFYGVQHFLHPAFVPDIPLPKATPTWVPFPSAWGYLAGAVLLAAGIGLALNKKSRMAAASIGTLMTAVTLILYLPALVHALIGPTPEINEALNYFADTLVYAGSAFALASVLPREG